MACKNKTKKAVVRLMIALCVCAWIYSSPLAFEVTVLPPAPQGGEAFLVSIHGGPDDEYRVTFKGEEYIPYAQKNGAREIFLPLAINDGGTQKIKVLRTALSSTEEKEIAVEVKKRFTALVRLRPSDEKMRDDDKISDEQNQLILKTLRHRSGDRLWEEGFDLPLNHRISTAFAVHRKGKTYDYYHKGLDFSAPEGTPVKAVNDGKVIMSAGGLNVYGNIIIVDHGQGVVSCYFHMSALLKTEGDMVKRGDVIGKVGSTGWATGPHLHMGVYVQGKPVDPVWWIDFSKEKRDAPVPEYAADGAQQEVKVQAE